MHPETLKQAAMVGTLHSPLTTGEPETVLIDFVQHAIQKRAGFVPPMHSEPAPQPVKRDKRAFSHPQVIAVLEMLISTRSHHLLGEWIERVERCNKRVPPEYLSSLMHWLEDRDEYHGTFRAVAGEYVPWLAEQNTRWRPIVNRPVPVNREIYDGVWWERARATPLNPELFEKMRDVDPQRAVDILEEQWDDLEENAQAELIFNFNAGYDDEPFLESLLDGESQLVSKFARDQLKFLPNSRYIERLMTYAAHCLVIERHATVEVVRIKLDYDLTEGMRRDGLEDGIDGDDEAREIFRVRNQRRYAVRSMLSSLPPSLWCAHFNRDAKTLYDLFLNSQWQDTLTQDFAEAAYIHRDPDWIRALVEANIDGDRLGDKLLTLISLLPEEEKDVYFLRWWMRSNSFSRRKQIKEYITDRSWSRTFSRGILEQLSREHRDFTRQYMSRQQNNDLHQMIEVIVFHIHADEIPYAREIFSHDSMKQFTGALSRLQLRQEITAAFKFE
ncbi:MAG: DUF5691 domain-containing protein [Chloroflexota bacterium]